MHALSLIETINKSRIRSVVVTEQPRNNTLKPQTGVVTAYPVVEQKPCSPMLYCAKHNRYADDLFHLVHTSAMVFLMCVGQKGRSTSAPHHSTRCGTARDGRICAHG